MIFHKITNVGSQNFMFAFANCTAISMHSVTVLHVIIFLSTTFVNSNGVIPLDDTIVVNAINNYRKNLVCSQAARNMKLISSNKLLVEYAAELMNNQQIARNMNESFIKITSDTCAYQLTDTISLETNVLRFIQKCIRVRKTKQPGNVKVSWLWSPKHTTIGCAYSSSGTHFIVCVLNKQESETNFSTQIKIDSSKRDTDLLKQNGALFTNQCPRLERRNYRSCYLLTSTRDYIKNEVNRFRKNLVRQNEYYDLAEIEWDSSLEMAAIELSKFRRDSWADNCFTIASHLDGFVVREFVPNINFLVQPNLNREIIKFIAESDNLTWDLYAIGCTYFIVDSKGILLCVWNKDQSIMAAISYWAYNIRRNFTVNPFLVYVSIGMVLLNSIIIVLFMLAVRNFKCQKALRGKLFVERIYSNAE